MKNLLTSCLMICLAFTAIQAQNQPGTGTSKDQVIVKKITIQNVDGKETRSETVDTFDAANWNEESLRDEDLDIIIKDADDMEFWSGENATVIDPEQFQMQWNHAQEEEMTVTPPNKAVLGVQLNNVDGANGAQVAEVIEGSAAEKAGLIEGDILLSVDGKETNDVEKVIEALSDNKPGDKVKITYLRGTKVKTVKATLQERKEEKLSMKSCAPSCMSKVKCCKPGEWEKCMKNMNKEMREKIHHELKELKGTGDNKKKMIIINKNPGEVKIKRSKGTGSNNDIEIINGDGSTRHIIGTNGNQALSLEYLTSSPNPSNGHMKIRFAGPSVPTTIQVLDLNGKEVYNEKIENFDGAYNKEIDIRNEARGTLILKIIQGDKIMTQKIIVE
jgi:hypothetical protein